MVWTWHSLDLLPVVYDVIWCQFPHRPAVGVPADPPHPVVVRAIERNDAAGQAIVARHLRNEYSEALARRTGSNPGKTDGTRSSGVAAAHWNSIWTIVSTSFLAYGAWSFSLIRVPVAA